MMMTPMEKALSMSDQISGTESFSDPFWPLEPLFPEFSCADQMVFEKELRMFFLQQQQPGRSSSFRKSPSFHRSPSGLKAARVKLEADCSSTMRGGPYPTADPPKKGSRITALPYVPRETYINRVRARIYALHLMSSSYLPEAKPDFIPLQAWIQMRKLKECNQLVKICSFSADTLPRTVTVSLPVSQDILIYSVVANGQKTLSGYTSPLQNKKTLFRWWTDPTGVYEIDGIKNKQSDVKQPSHLRLVERTFPLPHIYQTKACIPSLSDLSDYFCHQFECSFMPEKKADKLTLVQDGFQNRRTLSEKTPRTFATMDSFNDHGPHKRQWTKLAEMRG